MFRFSLRYYGHQIMLLNKYIYNNVTHTYARIRIQRIYKCTEIISCAHKCWNKSRELMPSKRRHMLIVCVTNRLASRVKETSHAMRTLPSLCYSSRVISRAKCRHTLRNRSPPVLFSLSLIFPGIKLTSRGKRRLKLQVCGL